MIYLLNDTKKEGVVNIPLLKTLFLTPAIDLKPYNSLIFSSKNAVLAIDKLGVEWKEKHIFTIGEATSKCVESLGAKVFYTSGNGYGEGFAKEIIKKYPFGKYLYCRAKDVATDMGEILKRSGISVGEAIVYKTECAGKSSQKIEKNSVVIFTSPKIARCFFRFYEWNDSLKAVCIGRTTKKALPKNIEVYIPDETTLESALKLASELQY